MDNLQEINHYISNMKIKKTLFGGYDREDVYVKLGVIVEMFQKCMDEYEEKEKALIEDYERRMSASDLLIGELNKKITSLSANQRDAEEEKAKLKEAYKEYCSNILQRYSDSLRTLSSEFAQIIDNVTNLQKNIINEDIFEKVEASIETQTVEELPDQERENEEE